jgi:hypothetical protein
LAFVFTFVRLGARGNTANNDLLRANQFEHNASFSPWLAMYGIHQ